jgi:hypothetical protein
LFKHQIQDIDNASSTPISIIEGVYALKLEVDDSHFHQNVSIIHVVIINEKFKIAHEFDYVLGILRRDINCFACLLISQLGSCQNPET